MYSMFRHGKISNSQICQPKQFGGCSDQICARRNLNFANKTPARDYKVSERHKMTTNFFWNKDFFISRRPFLWKTIKAVGIPEYLAVLFFYHDIILFGKNRRDAEPEVCPFRGPFTYSYAKGGSGAVCSFPRSYLDSCQDPTKLQLSFQVRVDVMSYSVFLDSCQVQPSSSSASR